MSHRWKPIVACVSLIVSMTVAGCNRGGGDASQSAAAAIAGPNAASPTPDGSIRTATTSDPQHPEVVIETTLGKITVLLDAEKAHFTVENFLRYIAAGHYDQTIVHQVYKGQVFLAGGYGKNFIEKPVRTPILNEADNGLKNLRGTIAMARLPDNQHSATSQFFINLADNPALDHTDRSPDKYGYCVFGKVTAGMDVVQQIGNVKVQDTRDFDCTPVDPVVITSIKQTR